MGTHSSNAACTTKLPVKLLGVSIDGCQDPPSHSFVVFSPQFISLIIFALIFSLPPTIIPGSNSNLGPGVTECDRLSPPITTVRAVILIARRFQPFLFFVDSRWIAPSIWFFSSFLLSIILYSRIFLYDDMTLRCQLTLLSAGHTILHGSVVNSPSFIPHPYTERVASILESYCCLRPPELTPGVRCVPHLTSWGIVS